MYASLIVHPTSSTPALLCLQELVACRLEYAHLKKSSLQALCKHAQPPLPQQGTVKSLARQLAEQDASTGADQ